MNEYKENNNAKTGKHKCKDINVLLVDYASEKLLQGDIQRIKEHLPTCRNCREEYRLLQGLARESQRLDEERDAVMASIDWEETAQTITSNIPFKSAVPRKSRKPWFNFDLHAIPAIWKTMVPVMTGVFLLGIWLGYLLFHDTNSVKDLYISESSLTSESSLARLENTLARKEVVSYFDQTQLVLTDLMKQCSTDGTFSLQSQVDMRRVRTLLGRSRYFKENLNNPQLLSSQQLLKKIEWLLYEILMSDIEDNTSCKKLQQLQDYIKQERLLFKIRLVGKELSISEV